MDKELTDIPLQVSPEMEPVFRFFDLECKFLDGLRILELDLF